MRHGRFAKRLIASYLVLAVIPLLTLLVIVGFHTMETTKHTMQTRLRNAAALAEAQFASIKDTMEFISLNIICQDGFIQKAKGLTYDDNTVAEEKEFYQGIQASICTYSNVQSIYRLSFFNLKGHFVTNEHYNNRYSSQTRLRPEAIAALAWRGEVDRLSGKAILLPVSDHAIPEFTKQALTLVRSVRDPGKNVGYLAVQILLEDMDYMFGADKRRDFAIMIQQSGQVIYATDDFPVQQSLMAFDKALEKNYLVSSVPSNDRDITVTLVSPMRLVYEQVIHTMAAFLLGGAMLLLLTIVGILVFAKRFSLPLVALKEEMGAITLKNLNRLSSNQPYERYEETKYLYDEFFKMRQRLDSMIQNELTLKTLHMRELLHSLQGQINPHFLYNTLSVIGIMGAENGDSRVYDACLKLSEMLRYFISERGIGSTTIGAEMENTKHYLELMRLRFEERIQYTLECEERVANQAVLRLTMQPFVENIFEHAFDTDHMAITVAIRAYEEDSDWVISIRDNGANMDPSALAKLQGELAAGWEDRLKASDESGERIGIYNTILRLKLFFQDAFRYSIENVPGGGFVVTLRASMREYV